MANRYPLTLISTTISELPSGDALDITGCDIVTTSSSVNLLNTGATSINFGQAATTISIGATTGTTTVRNGLVASTLSATTITETSSERLKENIVNLHSPTALSCVLGLQGVHFDWKDKTVGSRTNVGFIAEQVANNIPEVVDYDENGNTVGVQYSKIVAYLVEAIKEQQKQIDQLKSKLG